MHGTFFLGDFGDRLIQIAAGLVTLLVITGLYLWWPRSQLGLYASLRPRTRAGRRVLWRDLHSIVGICIALGLLFFTISGLSWTGIWDERLVQAWNSFPAEKTNAPLSHRTHESLNHGAHKEVPWNLEQTPLPASGSMAGAELSLSGGLGERGPTFDTGRAAIVEAKSADSAVPSVAADRTRRRRSSPVRSVHRTIVCRAGGWGGNFPASPGHRARSQQPRPDVASRRREGRSGLVSRLRPSAPQGIDPDPRA
jgi:uncharacterized iron-regulated membrane protein